MSCDAYFPSICEQPGLSADIIFTYSIPSLVGTGKILKFSRYFKQRKAAGSSTLPPSPLLNLDSFYHSLKPPVVVWKFLPGLLPSSKSSSESASVTCLKQDQPVNKGQPEVRDLGQAGFEKTQGALQGSKLTAMVMQDNQGLCYNNNHCNSVFHTPTHHRIQVGETNHHRNHERIYAAPASH